LPLAAHAAFQRHMADLEAAVFHLDLDQATLTVRPTQAAACWAAVLARARAGVDVLSRVM
jgi:hypothetical protein